MATRVLRHWPGDIFIYVGEMMRGCAEPDFFLTLVEAWSPLTHVELPHWFNRCDDLWIFERANDPDPSWLQTHLARFGVTLNIRR